jgi:hypothetical protein
MSLLSVREDIKAALDDSDFSVYTYIPAGVQPPLVMIAENDPYIEPTQIAFGTVEYRVNLRLILIADEVDNESAIGSINEMITDVLQHVGDWNVVSVSAPYQDDANEYNYLFASVNVSTTFTLE